MSRTEVVTREKVLKGWSRQKKLELIAKTAEPIKCVCPEQGDGSPAPGASVKKRPDFIHIKSGLFHSARMPRKTLIQTLFPANY